MSIMSNVTKYNINARHKLCLINQMYNNVHRVINRIFRIFSRWKGWLIYPNLGGEEDDCSASSPFISGRNSRLKNVWTQSLKKIPLNTVLALLTITWSPINSSKILQTDPQGFWLSLHEVLFRPNIVHPVSCLETDQK